MTRTPEDISALTGLRGFATLWVVTHHFWEFIGFPAISVAGLNLLPFIKNAYFGLDMFFVLSGFLVVRPYIRAAQGLGRMPSFWSYMMRRVRRVVPAYWANLTLLCLFIWIGTGQSPVSAIEYFGYLGFLFWFTLPAASMPLNPVWWTLPVEWWAYFVLPALALSLKRVPAWLWLAAIMLFVLWTRIGIVSHFFAGDTSFWWQPIDYRHLRSRFDQFALGVLAAWIFERGISVRQARAIGWTGVGLFAVVFVHVGWFVPRWFEEAIRPWMYVHFTAAALPLAMIILAMAGGWRPLARLFEGRVFMLAGVTSYSLYLWHFPIFVWVFKHAPGVAGWPLAARAVVALVLAALATWIAYRLFERPFLSTRARGDKAAAAAGQSLHA